GPECRRYWVERYCRLRAPTGDRLSRCLSTPASFARAREHRLLTVPSATPSRRAVSATEYPCMSTATTAARCSTGRVISARCTTIAVSTAAVGSPVAATSSRNAAVGRDLLRRNRSRHELTTMRCSQLLTAESYRNAGALRWADSIASC